MHEHINAARDWKSFEHHRNNKVDLGVLNTNTDSAFFNSMHNFEILGSPIGSPDNVLQPNVNRPNACFFLYPRCMCDPQIAVLIFRLCAGFCKLAHLARSTPFYLPSMHFSSPVLLHRDIFRLLKHSESQVLFKWCLGLAVSSEHQQCPLCQHGLNIHGHHSLKVRRRCCSQAQPSTRLLC